MLVGLTLAGITVGCGSTPTADEHDGIVADSEDTFARLDERHAEDSYARGIEAEERRDYADAREAYLEAQSYVARYRDTGVRLQNLSEILTAKAEYDEAKGVASGDRQAQLAINYAHALRARLPEHRDLESARRLLEEAAWTAPHNPDAHIGLGLIAQERGSLGDAIRHYQLALEAEPRNAAAHYQLAFLYRSRLGEDGPDPMRALEHARAAVENAAEPRAHYLELLAAAHHDLGELDAAIENLEQAVGMSDVPRYARRLAAYRLERDGPSHVEEPLPFDEEPLPGDFDELDELAPGGDGMGGDDFGDLPPFEDDLPPFEDDLPPFEDDLPPFDDDFEDDLPPLDDE